VTFSHVKKILNMKMNSLAWFDLTKVKTNFDSIAGAATAGLSHIKAKVEEAGEHVQQAVVQQVGGRRR